MLYLIFFFLFEMLKFDEKSFFFLGRFVVSNLFWFILSVCFLNNLLFENKKK